MGAIQRHSKGDEEVYEAVDANLAAGVLVIPSTTTTASGLQGVAVAGAGALNVVGVSLRSAVTSANQAAATAGTGSDGYPFANTAVPAPTLTCPSNGIYPLTFTAVAVAYGVRLKAAAAGAVAAFVHGTDDPAMVIGYCAQPGGVSSAGGIGLVKLTL